MVHIQEHGRMDKDSHDLPSSWKSNIFLLNPTNTEWQAYIAQKNDDVYANLDFDGYQIDQLETWGDRYDYDGNKVNLPGICLVHRSHETEASGQAFGDECRLQVWSFPDSWYG